MTVASAAFALTETVDGIPYDTYTLITEKAGPVPVEPLLLHEKSTRGRGFIEELDGGRYRVRAKAQHCGIQNRNGRIYPNEVWGQHLREGTDFQAKINGRGVIGHLEHPDDGKSKMPLAAIVVTEAFPPDENGEVWIVFETLSTKPGRCVEAYIRDGVRFGLSSRGNGSVQHKNGVDEVQLDFDPITWDCVIDESTPGAEVRARSLKEDLDGYVKALVEQAGGNFEMAKQLAEADGLRAVKESAVDCSGGVCKCLVTESELPPSGYSRYLLAFEDGSAHYRAYQGTAGQWEVWLHPHNLGPSRLATKIPTYEAARGVAENHYKLILASGHYSAQQHAAHSNAIGTEGAQIKPVAAPSPYPNVAGMAAMMPHQSQQQRTPKIVLSFESVEVKQKAIDEAGTKFNAWLEKVQEEWKQVASQPYSGTMLELELSSGSECEKAMSILQKAGFFVTKAGDTTLAVSTSYEDGEQAKAHVCRVLTAKGIKKMQAEHVGRIRAGKVITEGTMKTRKRRRRIAEYAPDKSAAGGMAGGDTVPDDDEEPDGISPTAKIEDPEDLDLDLDVNEEYGEPIDYDYAGDDVEEVLLYDEDPGMGDDDMGDDDDDDDDEPEMEASRMPMDYAGMGEQDDDMGDDEYDDDEYDDEMYEALPSTYGTDTPAKRAAARKALTPAEKAARQARARAKLDKKRSARMKRESVRAYFKTFNRLNEQEKVVGAVRVWFNESDQPTAYEYYNKQGMLEGIRNDTGAPLYAAEGSYSKKAQKFISAKMRKQAKEGKRPVAQQKAIALSMAREKGLKVPKKESVMTEFWRDENGEVVKAPVFEQDLPARHGGSSKVTMKGDQWKGKDGPEYSMKGMNPPGDRGQDGTAQKPGDYDKASEEGEGKHLEKGTWPESVDFNEIAKLREENERLRDKVAFMEDELASYEDVVQEQHEAIDALREAQEEIALVAERNRILKDHPELHFAEARLMRCESIDELQGETDMLVTLIEQAQPAPQPAALVEDVRPNEFTKRSGNGVASTEARGVPTTLLDESSSPISEGLGRVNTIGTGNVASRVAAARRRRRMTP